MFRDMSSSYEKIHRHEYDISHTDPFIIAANMKRCETAAYVAYLQACNLGDVCPLSFEQFMGRAVELDQKWRTEAEAEQMRIDAEGRAAKEHSRRIGPGIWADVLRKKASILSNNGDIIRDLDKLVCPGCKTPFDWEKYTLTNWTSGSDTITDEKTMRKNMEAALDDRSEHSQLYCQNLIPTVVVGRDGRPTATGEKDLCRTKLSGRFWRFIKK